MSRAPRRHAPAGDLQAVPAASSAPTSLSAETRAVLRDVRPASPLFSNQILAELFEASHTRGPFKLLPRSVGGYVVYDERRPVGQRTVEVIAGSEEQAHRALERWAEHDAKRTPAPAALEGSER